MRARCGRLLRTLRVLVELVSRAQSSVRPSVYQRRRLSPWRRYMAVCSVCDCVSGDVVVRALKGKRFELSTLKSEEIYFTAGPRHTLIIVIVIIIIVWLIQWPLPFLRVTSMPVDFVLDDPEVKMSKCGLGSRLEL